MILTCTSAIVHELPAISTAVTLPSTVLYRSARGIDMIESCHKKIQFNSIYSPINVHKFSQTCGYWQNITDIQRPNTRYANIYTCIRG